MEDKEEEINILSEKLETLEAANQELNKAIEDKDKYINQLEKEIKNLEHYKANDVNLGFLNMIRKRIIKKHMREYLCQ